MSFSLGKFPLAGTLLAKAPEDSSAAPASWRDTQQVSELLDVQVGWCWAVVRETGPPAALRGDLEGQW